MTEKILANSSLVTYNTYMQLGTDGIRGLADFNAENGVRYPVPPIYMLNQAY